MAAAGPELTVLTKTYDLIRWSCHLTGSAAAA
jgi:hypothetical protein